jgi:hypothetical protein
MEKGGISRPSTIFSSSMSSTSRISHFFQPLRSLVWEFENTEYEFNNLRISSRRFAHANLLLLEVFNLSERKR